MPAWLFSSSIVHADALSLHPLVDSPACPYGTMSAPMQVKVALAEPVKMTTWVWVM